MAYLSSTLRPTLADRFSAFAERVRTLRAQRALYKRTLAELSQLNDRELADIGISRLSIEDIAQKHAYGA
jgi:uncharacterized protein YjiS (DUF1127 family)